MELFYSYLIESAVVLGIFTAFYRLVLHHERLFKFNRFYILASLCIATLVPFVHFTISTAPENTELTFTNILDTVNVYANNVQQNIVPLFAKHKFFLWMYIIGLTALFFRLMLGFFRLGGLSNKANWIKENDVKIADLPGHFNPFSFFHVIFVNRSVYSFSELEKIISHEKAHARFYHSVDVILFELFLIVQWFNPFAWLLKYLLKELHEFQADECVLNNGAPIGEYKRLLLLQATGARLLPVNNLNQSLTKKRFQMMTQKNIKNKAFFKALIAFQLLLAVSFFFACDMQDNAEPETADTKTVSEESDLGPVFFVCEVMPEYPGGEMELRRYIAQNVKYPEEAQINGEAGRAYIQFIVTDEGKIADVKVARSTGYELLDDEAIRVVSSMPEWTPGMQKGKTINVSYTIPINFVLSESETDSNKIIVEE